MYETYDLVSEGYSYLKTGNFDKFGKLLHSGWELKRNLSKSITTNKIDEIYNTAIKNGALGGKLLGAGGGGFFLFYVPKSKIKRVTNSLKKLHICNFNFDTKGSEIIHNFF